jgi:hypothetical protein
MWGVKKPRDSSGTGGRATRVTNYDNFNISREGEEPDLTKIKIVSIMDSKK